MIIGINVGQTIVAGGSVIASFLFGGWSEILAILLAFVIFDYLTGIAAAGFEGKLNSNIGLKGIANKVFIFVMVAVASMVDMSLGSVNLIKDATIFFYLSNELLSIVENGGRLGVKIPDPITKAIEILKGKSNISKDNNKTV